MRRISVALPICLLVLAGCSDDPDDSDDDAAGAAGAVLTKLAESLGEGGRPLAEVAFVDKVGADVAERYAEIIDGGDGTGILEWSWPVVESSDPWAYETTVELRRSGGTWAVRWAPTVVEPGLTDDEVLEATTIPATRGEILGARGAVIVTDRPVLRFGIDRVQVSKAAS